MLIDFWQLNRSDSMVHLNLVSDETIDIIQNKHRYVKAYTRLHAKHAHCTEWLPYWDRGMLT